MLVPASADDQALEDFAVAILAVVFVVLGASFIYAKFINKADDEFDSADVKERLTTTTVHDNGLLEFVLIFDRA